MDLPGLTDPPRTLPRSPALKSDPFAQLKLLDVQELDARVDLLRHQRASLPENKELAALGAQRAEVDAQARDAKIRVDDLTREQKRSDADVEQVKTRRKRDQDRMDQGLISNPKDLERMQHEMVSLERRIAELEAKRRVTAEDMPADLMALYEKLRASKGGVGAAALRTRQCTGCSLQLNASDLGVIAKAPSNEVLRCEECDRILVRTAESGI